MRFRWLLTLGSLSVCLAAEKPVDFNRDVRPILSDNCFACHGPDDKRRMANLRLDTEDGLFADRGTYRSSRPAIQRRAASWHASAPPTAPRRMPPPQAGADPHRSADRHRPQMDRAGRQVGAALGLRAAAAAGACRRSATRMGAQPDRPLRAGPPGTRRTEALARGRPRHPAAPPELRPHRPAAHHRRSRTPSSPTNPPNAYEKQVDRLLALPHYGERMAMQWLDLARYADTHGYHIDSQRDMWKWRDWVIDAFNRNMPFDRFGIEQLAGDLLPNATVRAETRHRLQPQPHDQLRGRRDSRGVSGRSTWPIASTPPPTSSWA